MSLFNNKLSKVPLGMLDTDVQNKFTGYDTSLAQKVNQGDLFINVKNYKCSDGQYVQADGVHDDTTGIQAAINAINEVIVSSIGGFTYTASSLTLFFPNGVYRITNTLNLGKVHRIDFGKSILKLDTTNTNLFMFNALSYNAIYTGGAFSGYNIFTVNNSNSDQGMIRFLDMEFKGNTIAINANVQSSKCVIERCKFDGVTYPLVQVLCDDMQFINNWVEANRTPNNSDGNIQVKGGRLTVRDNMFIPLNSTNTTSTESSWIDFAGIWLTCDNNRFSGETGNRCPVNWHTDATYDATFNLCGINFINNLVAHNTSTDKTCAVRLYRFPNHLVVKNNYYGQLMNYVVAFSDNDLTNLNTSLATQQGKYFNYTDFTSPFYGDKYSRFYYNIRENNFYLQQHDAADYLFAERQNEWYFMLNNYKNYLSYTTETQRYTVTSSNTHAQNITNMQTAYTSGNRVVKLPLAGTTDTYGSAIRISVAWNDNYNGSSYHHVQEILFAYVKTYESSTVATKVVHTNLIPTSLDGVSTGIDVSCGFYDTSGTTYFDGSVPANIQGIALQFLGSYVTPYAISVTK